MKITINITIAENDYHELGKFSLSADGHQFEPEQITALAEIAEEQAIKILKQLIAKERAAWDKQQMDAAIDPKKV